MFKQNATIDILIESPSKSRKKFIFGTAGAGKLEMIKEQLV
jgi:hypothetical protein